MHVSSASHPSCTSRPHRPLGDHQQRQPAVHHPPLPPESAHCLRCEWVGPTGPRPPILQSGTAGPQRVKEVRMVDGGHSFHPSHRSMQTAASRALTTACTLQWCPSHTLVSSMSHSLRTSCEPIDVLSLPRPLPRPTRPPPGTTSLVSSRAEE